MKESQDRRFRLCNSPPPPFLSFILLKLKIKTDVIVKNLQICSKYLCKDQICQEKMMQKMMRHSTGYI